MNIIYKEENAHFHEIFIIQKTIYTYPWLMTVVYLISIQKIKKKLTVLRTKSLST